ncbi:MAG TPA: phospho-N-acetylmuramoyl-pentapeptide-transferase [Kiritimatiellae bacterium]|nr:phospho-N-acetylmuramoyl-pentapeptide-transferase [Kiritimatiellia bacterium]
MLYFLSQLQELFSPLRILRYVTLRSLGAAGTAFVLCLVVGGPLIRRLQRMGIGQQVRREEAPPLYEFHGKKAGTPTMGGVMIIITVLFSALLWARPDTWLIWPALGTMVYMGAVGFWDDYLKVSRRRSRGLGIRAKLLLQTAWIAAFAGFLWCHPEFHDRVRDLMVPFLKRPVLSGLPLAAVVLFLWFVIAGSVNAVNLTDGLDGLAIGSTNSVALAYLIMAYVAGHAVFARYLLIPYVAGAGELAVICGALLGSGLGFLWFNCHPARVFMGDTGSLALGGLIGAIAVLIKQELVLLIVGGVFVMEAASVVLQVAYFRLTGGRRLFRCAPLHHHFELLEKERAEREGRLPEPVETRITVRFWILSIMFALLGVATLKIR